MENLMYKDHHYTGQLSNVFSVGLHHLDILTFAVLMPLNSHFCWFKCPLTCVPFSVSEYARIHAEQNRWKVEENTTIKKQMNTRLSELRNIAKYKSQILSSESGDSENKGYSRYKNIVAALSSLPIVAQQNPSETHPEPKSQCSKHRNEIDSLKHS